MPAQQQTQDARLKNFQHQFADKLPEQRRNDNLNHFTLNNIARPNFFFSFRARPKATMT